jgi:hypothetical protein
MYPLRSGGFSARSAVSALDIAASSTGAAVPERSFSRLTADYEPSADTRLHVAAQKVLEPSEQSGGQGATGT